MSAIKLAKAAVNPDLRQPPAGVAVPPPHHTQAMTHRTAMRRLSHHAAALAAGGTALGVTAVSVASAETPPPSAIGANATAAPLGTGLEEHAASIQRIEQPRAAGKPGDGGCTISELMERHATPALSVAVVKVSPPIITHFSRGTSDV